MAALQARSHAPITSPRLRGEVGMRAFTCGSRVRGKRPLPLAPRFCKRRGPLTPALSPQAGRGRRVEHRSSYAASSFATSEESTADAKCSSEIGQVAYLGVTKSSDPIRRVIDETQISGVLHPGGRKRVVHGVSRAVARRNRSNLDLVRNTDRQQPHHLSVAEIDKERNPGQAQQARRVG